MLDKVIALAIRFALLGFLVFAAFQWGKNDCQKDQARANAKIRGDHAAVVNAADREATDRALDAQKKDLNNEDRVDEIVALAAAEDGADDICLSAGVVERLRELQ